VFLDDSIQKGREILNGTTDDVLNNNKIADAIQNIHLTNCCAFCNF
jgi:hypothetical protein